MTIASMLLDPNAASYTDNQIVDKVNTATTTISRASAVDAAARPIANLEVTEGMIAANAVTNAKVATGQAKANLDAMADTARGYIKTAPTTGEFPVISIQRGTVASGGKLDTDYDDVAI